MKKASKSLSIFLIILISISLTGCFGPSPDESVKGYFDALKKQDITAATAYIKDGNENFADNQQQEKIIKSIFSKLSYEVISTTKNGDTATVKTKVTAPDLVKITGKAISELMPQLFALAFSNDSNVDAQVNNLMEQYFINSINDPKMPMTTTEVDIKLVKDQEKKSWLIEPNESLANAITGNIISAFKEIGDSMEDNSNSSEVEGN